MYLRGLFRRIIEAMSEWDTNGRKALSRYSQCNLYLLVHATLALVRAELDRATGFMGNAMDCACPVARTCPINHRCRHRYLLLHQLRHQRRGNSRSLRCSAATCNQRPIPIRTQSNVPWRGAVPGGVCDSLFRILDDAAMVRARISGCGQFVRFIVRGASIAAQIRP